MTTQNRALCKVPIFRRDPVPPTQLLSILHTDAKNLYHQDLHIHHRGCCGRVNLCTLYIPLTPSSESQRQQAREGQDTSGAAAMEAEQYDAGKGRGRGKGSRAPDVVISLPSRITLKLIPREGPGYKFTTATGVLVDTERPDFDPENRQDGRKGEEASGGEKLEVDRVFELELSLVGGQLVGSTDVYCSVCSAWMDRFLGLLPGCC